MRSPDDPTQRLLSSEFVDAARADDEARRRYGWLAHAMTGEGTGPRLFREIGALHEEVLALAAEKGVQSEDERTRGLRQTVEGRFFWAKQDERLSSPHVHDALAEIRQRLVDAREAIASGLSVQKPAPSDAE